VSDTYQSERGVIDRGAGPAILFAHGMGLDCRLFAPQVEALARDYHTIAYNLRAHSLRGAIPYTLYDLVSDFTAELDSRGIERCVLVGMSMGGYMAVRAALIVPQRLYGVVLIGASGIPFPAEDVAAWRADAERWRHRAMIGAERGRADAEQNFARTTQRRDPDLISRWAERIAQRSGAASYCEFLSWAYQDDVREAFSALKLPCLLMHGQEDAAVPLSHALKTHALLPSARLLVLPYAGHAANLEYPEIVNAVLSQFCQQSVAASGSP
jgi:pimeloyl-ACP methyl ester carboxylesterase